MRFFLLAYFLLTVSGCKYPTVEPGVFVPASELANATAGDAVDANSFVRTDQKIPAGLLEPGVNKKTAGYASPDEIDRFSKEISSDYHLGPGDKFAFMVRGREDISVDEVIVAPDGNVALPTIGILHVQGQTLTEATTSIKLSLKRYYERPDVTLVMKEYNNNKAYVLGRVANPGAVHFDGPGTVLEALALAGGLPVDINKSFLTRCMIVRGNEFVLWIDLRDLLENGNMALNARLRNGDVVFIPESDDSVAYVMGEVLTPGLLVLRSQMTVLDAVMNSGGLTDDADPERIFLVRAGNRKGVVEQIDLTAFIKHGDLRKNFILKEGDILYAAGRDISEFNYFMTQLVPAMTVIDFTLNAAERFGAMQQLRMKLWGQEGFVNTTE